jgi:DNA repair exonuclease SbcCD ATPase subunit
MITIKENDKPKVRKCKMLCDTMLDEKLEKYELTKYLNKHQSSIIIGMPGSGKTSLLYTLFKSKPLLKGVFDKVFIIQPPSSRNSMSDDIFSKLPEEQVFDDLTLETLEKIDADLHEGSNCLIMDDVTASLKDNSIRKKLRQLIYNRRHKHLSIFFLVQSYKSIHKDIRKIFNNIFAFRCSKSEFEDIFDEVVESKKKYLDDIIQIVYDKSHEFLFINLETQNMFKGFDSLVFPEEH